MRKPSKSTLTRKLDKAVSEIVRARGRCAWCGKEEGLECAHIFSRRYRSVRWDLMNLLCLCHSHHFYAHANPILFAEFVKDHLGDGNYSQLKLRAQGIKKWSTTSMELLLEELVGRQ